MTSVFVVHSDFGDSRGHCTGSEEGSKERRDRAYPILCFPVPGNLANWGPTGKIGLSAGGPSFQHHFLGLTHF